MQVAMPRPGRTWSRTIMGKSVLMGTRVQLSNGESIRVPNLDVDDLGFVSFVVSDCSPNIALRSFRQFATVEHCIAGQAPTLSIVIPGLPPLEPRFVMDDVSRIVVKACVSESADQHAGRFVVVFVQLIYDEVKKEELIQSELSSVVSEFTHCDHLGVAVLQPSVINCAIDKVGVRGPVDLVAFMGSSNHADILLQDGAFVPAWGMRPWHHLLVADERLVRLSIDGVVRKGQFVVQCAHDCEYEIHKTSALRQWHTEEPLKPLCVLGRPRGRQLCVTLDMCAGHTPMSFDMKVGVLPVLSIGFTENLPLSTGIGESALLFVGDPFAI